MQCEICNLNVARDKHHIQSKSLGGSNAKSNIANLCPNCHREVHLGIKIIEGKFLSTEGFKVIWRTKQQMKIISEVNDPEIFCF